MSEIELKACPFCGRAPKISDIPESAIHVSCRCGASLFGEKHHHSDHAEATARWNARAPQWQPIESAPRSGRQMILILTPSGFPQVVFSNTWWISGFSIEFKPTHWMPLPAPPEVEG